MKAEWKYFIAAIVGAAIFILVVVSISNANDSARARDCDLMGTTMLKDRPYKCSRIVPDSPTPPDPGHERGKGATK